MRSLGLNAYRFSLSWSRILPAGRGAVNPRGLDFYSRLIDALLESGITPCATLFHWDLPAALDDRGGWLNRDVAGWFADYAAVVFRALDDRVPLWTTLNEPWVVVDGGYLCGTVAPGHRNLFEAPLASLHLMRAHGAAVAAYRSLGRHQIGLVVNLEPKYPASERPEDLAATRRADAYMNRQFLDPALLGRYPEEMVEVFGPAWPEIAPGDLIEIHQPIDFLGINYYTRSVTRDAPDVLPVRAAAVRQARSTYTETGWEVYPQGLTDILLWVRERYGDLPLYVTENGAAFYDPPQALGEPHEDPLRVAYFRDHLRAVHRALEQGVDLRGYFAWSLLDNFEWSLGYAKRFGLVHVDFATQRRTLKASARYYARVIASRGGALTSSD
jgi:beta-glucosidase